MVMVVVQPPVALYSHGEADSSRSVERSIEKKREANERKKDERQKES